MVTTLEDRQKKIVDEFSALATWEDRYKKIIERGKALGDLPDSVKTEDAKVKGCQSQVWLLANLREDGRLEFKADSDAMIVKGLIALLLDVYSLATPEEILHAPPAFLKQLGFDSHLSPSRANGLFAMVRQIMYYATAFQALAKMKK